MELFGFLILAALATLFGVGGLLLSDRSTTRRETSRALFKQRQAEVEVEEADTEVQAALKTEAGRALLQSEEQSTDLHPEVAEPAKVNVLLLALCLPIFGLGLYFWLADVGVGDIRGAEVVLTLNGADEANQEQLRQWREKLGQRVADEPDDSKSRYLLAHTFLQLGEYQSAAEAFAEASRASPEDTTIRIYWLQARFLASRGRMDSQSQALAEEILAASPNMPVVMEMLAMDAVQDGKPADAVNYLNRALSAARDAQRQVSFVAAINQLREQFEMPGVTVEVSADGELPHGATLFVIARPVGGGMPLAVVKMPAVLIPQTVRLDDLVSMNQVTKLSSAEQFEVVVRISLSGSPMAQAGDWQWQSLPMNLKSNETLQARLTAPN